MANVIISKNAVDNFFNPNVPYDQAADIRIDNVTKVAVGGRLIWVEYSEDDQERYRAFGRDEFVNVIVQTDAEFAVFPVGNRAFKNFEYLV